jgi:hypothetical protein
MLASLLADQSVSLVTILVVLAIIALLVFIFRGRL